MIANGLGPWWFPAFARNFLTRLSKRFFNEAAWDKHDEGYDLGVPSRTVCDRKFLQAMLRDASQTTTTGRVLACVGLALTYWALARVFGVFSYNRRRG
jgi:hypothetical protein